MDSLIGPWAVLAAIAVIAIALALAILRELRGPGARVTTVAESHPWLTSAAGAVTVIAIGLFVLRLGALT